MMKTWKEIFAQPKPLKMYVLHTGYVHMAGNIHFNRKNPKTAAMPKDTRFNPVFAFLVDHPEKGRILFDTGLHQSFAGRRFGNFGPLLGTMVKTKTEAGMDVVSQLGKIGLSTADIHTIVLSHLHLDHPSSLPNFRNHDHCRVYVNAAELKKARAPWSSLKGYVRSHLKGIEFNPLQFHTSLEPFPYVCDFLGDGSVFLLATPGHTPGHLSVVLNLERGPVLLTFDAAHRRANFTEEIPPVGDHSQALDSLRKLKAFAFENRDIRVIFSHDPDQLDDLKLLPDHYT